MKGKKICNYLKVSFGVLFLSLSVGLFGSSSANAVSDYDYLVKEKQPLILKNMNNESEEKDYSLNWYNDALTAVQYNCENGLPAVCGYVDYLENLTDEGNNWAVVHRDNQFQIISSTDPLAKVVFGTDYPGEPYGYDYYAISGLNITVSATFYYSTNLGSEESNWLFYSGGGAPQVTNFHIMARSDPTPNHGIVPAEIFLSTFDVEYPPDYEGTLIPDSYNPGIVSDWTPDILLHKGSNWVVEFSDYNFFTFDKVAFTCGEEGFAPTINWYLYDITEDANAPILIDEYTFSASAVYEFTAEKVPRDKTYKVVARYSGCDGWTFPDVSEKEFMIKKDGNLRESDYMTVCLKEEFPYIDFGGCVDMLNSTLVALSFNTLRWEIGNDWSFTESCRSLQVLGDWMFTEDQSICPKIPSNVRNVVTPFITMAIGLLMITFIAKRGDHKV